MKHIGKLQKFSEASNLAISMTSLPATTVEQSVFMQFIYLAAVQYVNIQFCKTSSLLANLVFFHTVQFVHCTKCATLMLVWIHSTGGRFMFEAALFPFQLNDKLAGTPVLFRWKSDIKLPSMAKNLCVNG